jgi:Flp pilus assembly protein TadD
MKRVFKKFIVMALLISVALQIVGCKHHKEDKPTTTEKQTKQIQEEDF